MPPDLVVTIISPLSFLACPTRHTILLADIHSAVRRQLCPQIVRPMRSAGPVPRFSPLIVTFVHGMPSFGEMPVTRGGCRDRDIVLAEETRSSYRSNLQDRTDRAPSRGGRRPAPSLPPSERRGCRSAARPSFERPTTGPQGRGGAGRGQESGDGWEPRTRPRPRSFRSRGLTRVWAAATRSPRGRGTSGQEP